MIENNFIAIPRVESKAPNKNTIEWEIPNKVKVGIMLIERIGYTFIAQVYINKKHWWNTSRKTFVVSSLDVMEIIFKGQEFLRKYGYYIDADTVQFGEVIGQNQSTNN